MYYTNTHYINNNGLIDNPYSFKLPFGHTCFPLIKEVEVTSDNLYNLTSPINSLTTIMSNTPFQVLGAKVKFYY
ncbi:MAG: hypothetical protein MJ200_00790 [Mycoplasmoidaceae bacterium]|nr:hypothetical protein [Mycoplasmoidaceae bacterium]